MKIYNAYEENYSFLLKDTKANLDKDSPSREDTIHIPTIHGEIDEEINETCDYVETDLHA